MLNRFRFRGIAKMTDKPKMVYGWGCYTDTSERQYIVYELDGKPDFVQVEEIQQCVGFADKHKRFIYEGDTIEERTYQNNEVEVNKGIVEWSDFGKSFKLVDDADTWDIWEDDDLHTYEIKRG